MNTTLMLQNTMSCMHYDKEHAQCAEQLNVERQQRLDLPHPRRRHKKRVDLGFSYQKGFVKVYRKLRGLSLLAAHAERESVQGWTSQGYICTGLTPAPWVNTLCMYTTLSLHFWAAARGFVFIINTTSQIHIHIEGQCQKWQGTNPHMCKCTCVHMLWHVNPRCRQDV